MYYLYIITNRKNGTIYTGVTGNLEKRVFEHKHKLVDGFSKKYSLGTLVYIETFQYIDDAISAEKRIKGWKRDKKIALIETKNPDWLDLDSSLGSE